MVELNQEAALPSNAPDIQSLRRNVEALKDQKGRLSRQVGEARKAGLPTEALVDELRAVSDRYKELSKALKRRLNSSATPDGTDAGPDWNPLSAFTAPDPDPEVARIRSDLNDPDLAAAWDRFVITHPLASPYHLMALKGGVERASGHSSRYFCALDNQSRVIGVLPLVRMKSHLFGHFVTSMPYFNYGGILANNRETARRLYQAAGNWAAEQGALHIEMRHLEESGLGLPQRTDKVTFWMPLPDDPELLWSSFKPKVRAQIRRPQTLRPRVRFGGGELLDDFYPVFARNMRDLGTPVYGKGFFGAILDALGGMARLVVVYVAERPVGCAFLIGFRNRMEIPWASTLRETNASGINMWMYWKILEYAIGQGYGVFDFGRCSYDSGTYRFKQQWGATPVPLIWEYWLPPGATLPRLNPDNPKFRVLIAVWRRLPLWMTRLLGPAIVKNLP